MLPFLTCQPPNCPTAQPPNYLASPAPQFYGLPWLSLRNAIWHEAEAGNPRASRSGGGSSGQAGAWSDVLADAVHPNDLGHK